VKSNPGVMKRAVVPMSLAGGLLGMSLLVSLFGQAALPAQAGAKEPTRQAPSAQPPTAQELLHASDRARGGLQSGVTWNITIDTVEEDQKTSRAAIVKVLRTDALVEMTLPPREKGQILLFNNRNLWFIKPGLRKPMSVSARQKLSGQAANGDIASTYYARDYQGTIVREEKVGNEDTYVLELKAIARNVTYDRIRYWISKSRQLGVKAEFLTLQGDIFKTAVFEYGNTLKVGSQMYPFVSQMRITDAAFPTNTTTIIYSAPRVEEHPASLFNINNVVR
jgi:Outer membrane lipoprotein-sorting protein